MIRHQYRLSSLIHYLEAFDDHTVPWSFCVVTFVLDRHPYVDRIVEKHRPHKP
jgi:hypothetical protein